MKFSLDNLKNLVDNNDTVYTISDKLNIDHKIIRSFLKLNNLPLHSIKNTSNKKSFIEPNNDLLFSPLSILAHTIYLCEGWHTSKTNLLSFVNQDVQLIKTFCECLKTTYQYKTIISISLVYNHSDDKSIQKTQELLTHFQNKENYVIYLVNDSTRKNPIIRINAGGKNLAYLFIENAYKILHSTS